MIATRAARHVADARVRRRPAPAWGRVRDALHVAALYLGGCGETVLIACAIAAHAPAANRRVPRSGWTRALGELALVRDSGIHRASSL